jgi:hypothetical protein
MKDIMKAAKNRELESSAGGSTRPKYHVPSIKVMDESEVLQAFQMTAAKISAAGCWWTCGLPPTG